MPFETGIESGDFGQQPAGETDAGDVLQFEQTGAQPVVDVVSVIGDVVGDRRRLRLGAGEERQLQRKQRVEFEDIGIDPPLSLRPRRRPIVFDQPLQGLPGEIQTVIAGVTALQLRHDAQGLGVVVEAAEFRHAVGQRSLPRVAKGRVAEIMS